MPRTIYVELDYPVGAVSNPKRPFDAIVDGGLLSSKIKVIAYLLEKVDILILGGRMISTFNRANGLPVGPSHVEEDMLDAEDAYYLPSRLKEQRYRGSESLPKKGSRL